MTTVKTAEAWEGDVLDRRQLGVFLYKLVIARYDAYHSAAGSGSLCVAIDADWGAGKSFFVDRWSADVACEKHPVIRFDAWVNDLDDDPLVGFMAQLRQGLQPLVEALPSTGKLKRQGAEKMKAVIQNARKAVMPATGVLAKGLAKKLTGIDVAELGQILSGSVDPDLDELGSTGRSLAGDALDKFFDAALQTHTEKQSAIKALRLSMEDLLHHLSQTNKIKLPLFIFVDELDRCRPDYAIRLLEGAKHLFDAQGLCFVFSTNLKQLAASAKAVYGASFHAERYLKRFLSFEYLLPPPNYDQFAQLLTATSVLTQRKLNFRSMLPKNARKEGQGLSFEFSLVAATFRLDLRSQKQIFRQSEAVASAIPEGRDLYAFYLFFLAAVLHVSVETFDKLKTGDIGILAPLELDNQTFPFETHTDDGRYVKGTESTVALFWKLHGWARKSRQDLQKEAYTDQYPQSLAVPIVESARQQSAPAIADYWQLVRRAGFVS